MVGSCGGRAFSWGGGGSGGCLGGSVGGGGWFQVGKGVDSDVKDVGVDSHVGVQVVVQVGVFRFFSGRGEQMGKHSIIRGGGVKGSKGTNFRWGGELNGTFLLFEFRFRNGLGRTLALQSLRLSHLINAEIPARRTKQK